ncbi:maleylpyruvate isomerase family mycothiol-dependent enzyme [Amycolatopsis sp. FDAARGOS 1241]|uniref:maleylpyruvate isomerase family mycothiol-dependent enzyme n=1 Tax=Amycolatopsis sp. FDAARGOS 1241 TaxID=2778070 RepID=UPI001EF345F4|nr:maleylpyruvate isomerase family mycothiol-dependent enzyme [Amycolatopsis sp. FDAARGOS 1241]
MEQYRVAQHGFGEVVARVPGDRWDAPLPCSAWTTRDVAGHVLWGRRMLWAWATGADYAETAGQPGAPNPGVLCPGDAAATWRRAYADTAGGLDSDVPSRVALIDGGEVVLASVLPAFVADTLVHTWDVAGAAGVPVSLDQRLVTIVFAWARSTPLRRPEFFGPELTPPTNAGETTRMLAFLGREASPVG